MLAEAGYPKMLTVANRLEAITALCVHSAILCRKGELDQFAVGLGPVLELAKKYPDTMNPLFVSCEEPNSCSITPEEFKALLVFESVEEKVKQYFLKYIDEEGERLKLFLLSLDLRAITQLQTLTHPSLDPRLYYRRHDCTYSRIFLVGQTTIDSLLNFSWVGKYMYSLVNTIAEFPVIL